VGRATGGAAVGAHRSVVSAGTCRPGIMAPIGKQPTHRPSRRDEIVDAAIGVFAHKGFVDASVGDVATAAGVAVTAVYYHFDGKEDLFGASMARVLSAMDAVVVEARPDGAHADEAALHRVIDAMWAWVDANPDAARLVHLHSGGATRQTAAMRREFDERRLHRAYAYLGDEDRPGGPAARRAAATLAIRTIVDLLIDVQHFRLLGGPLADRPPDEVRAAVHDVVSRILFAALRS
jgi:AcrR family transcriptional regulator